MELQQLAIVHLINVIAAKDQNVFRIFPFDRVDILINRIGRSLVPLFGGAELRWNGEDEFATIVGKNIPTQPNVTIERIGFVLDEDADPLELRIDAVRQRKIDD